MSLTTKDLSTTQTATLAAFLSARIRRDGPIAFRDWMEAALYHPTEGYYCRRDHQRWGREGDYRTSPERSDLFAATFARYFATLYEKLNSPSDWTIVEMGGGDGRFSRGVMQTLQNSFPHVFAATQYVIDETSNDSRARARKQVASFGNQVQFETLSRLDRISSGIVFSNELLDAFPVHRVTKKKGRLLEFYVTLTQDKRFSWTLGPLSTTRLSNYFEEYGLELAEDQIVEISLAIDDWLAQTARKLAAGYLITVDYGAELQELCDVPEHHQGTLRAYRQHRLSDDVLDRPGEQDITTTIDWTYVKRAGDRRGFQVIELTSQDKFLMREGLLDQLVHLSDIATGDAERLRLSTSAREMILPGGMSSSFQVLVQKRIAI
jgi:SAM-dependent MidA family methyltransferase